MKLSLQEAVDRLIYAKIILQEPFTAWDITLELRNLNKSKYFDVDKEYIDYAEDALPAIDKYMEIHKGKFETWNIGLEAHYKIAEPRYPVNFTATPSGEA